MFLLLLCHMYANKYYDKFKTYSAVVTPCCFITKIVVVETETAKLNI